MRGFRCWEFFFPPLLPLLNEDTKEYLRVNAAWLFFLLKVKHPLMEKSYFTLLNVPNDCRPMRNRVLCPLKDTL